MYPRLMTIATALPVLVGLAACSPEEPPITEADGLAGPDRAVTVTRTPVWEVGGIAAPEWAAFGEVSDLDFDGHGHLHVLDRLMGRVTVIGPAGGLVRVYGTPGRGPGEIAAPGPLVVRADGSAALYDYVHGAWLRFDEFGSFAGVLRVEDGSAPGPVAFASSDGSIVAPGTGAVEGSEHWVTPVRRYRPDPDEAGSVASGSVTIFEARALPPPPPPVVDQLTLGGRSITVRIPRERGYEPGLHLALFGDGTVAVADGFPWRVEIRDEDGAPVGLLERPIAPRPVTEARAEAERARRLAAVADGELPGFMISGRDGGMSPADRGSVRQFMEARLENMVFTDQVPVIEGLAVDSRGTLWVARSSDEPAVPGPTDLVTREGGYLGTLAPDDVAFPRAFGPDGLAAWVSTDEFGVLRIRVDRLSPPR